jgi:hypothetical protein
VKLQTLRIAGTDRKLFLGSSYIRAVLFIKNIGAAAERVRVHGDWYVNNYALDISPISNEGRYYTQ